MIPKNVIDKVGYFNECLGYPHQVYEDWEYGVRINKAGFKTLIDGTIILTHLRKISLINKINNNNNNPGNNLNIILSRLRGYISRRRAEALFRVLKAGDLKLKLEYSLYALSSWMILLLLFTHALHCFAVFTISYFIGWFIYYLHDFGFTKFKDSLLYTFIIIISRNIRAFALTLWLPLFYIGHMDKCNEQI
jgi:GT2 family glycosyltransferase